MVAAVGLGLRGRVADGDVAVLLDGGDGDLLVGVGGDKPIQEHLAVVWGVCTQVRVQGRGLGVDGAAEAKHFELVRVFKILVPPDAGGHSVVALLLRQDVHEGLEILRTARCGFGLWGAL